MFTSTLGITQVQSLKSRFTKRILIAITEAVAGLEIGCFIRHIYSLRKQNSIVEEYDGKFADRILSSIPGIAYYREKGKLQNLIRRMESLIEDIEYYEYYVSPHNYLKTLVKADFLGPVPWLILGYTLADNYGRTICYTLALLLHCYAEKSIVGQIKNIVTSAVKSLESKEG